MSSGRDMVVRSCDSHGVCTFFMYVIIVSIDLLIISNPKLFECGSGIGRIGSDLCVDWMLHHETLSIYMQWGKAQLFLCNWNWCVIILMLHNNQRWGVFLFLFGIFHIIILMPNETYIHLDSRWNWELWKHHTLNAPKTNPLLFIWVILGYMQIVHTITQHYVVVLWTQEFLKG